MMQKVEKSEFPLRKPLGTLVMKLLIGKLTPSGRKIFCYLLNEAQNTLEHLKKENKFLLAEDTFSTPIRQLEHFLSENRSEKTDSGMKSVIDKYLKELFDTKVSWSTPGNNGGTYFGAAHLLTQHEISEDGNFISWSFPPILIKELKNPGQYIPISLSQIAKLRLYQSLCLYEICSRYKYNFEGKTCKNSPQWWVEVLSCSPQKEKKAKIWRQIKASVAASIAEINELTDITIEMKEFKTGKAVTEIQFTVIKKDSEVIKEINAEHVDVLNQAARLGVNIDAHLSNSKLADLKFALNKFEGQLTKNNSIEKPQAYLNSILKELPTSVLKTVEQANPVQHSILSREESSSAIFRKINSEFAALTLSQQIAYGKLVADESNQTMTEKMLDLFRKGSFSSSMLVIVTERFAFDVYGPDWKNLSFA